MPKKYILSSIPNLFKPISIISVCAAYYKSHNTASEESRRRISYQGLSLFSERAGERRKSHVSITPAEETKCIRYASERRYEYTSWPKIQTGNLFSFKETWFQSDDSQVKPSQIFLSYVSAHTPHFPFLQMLHGYGRKTRVNRLCGDTCSYVCSQTWLNEVRANSRSVPNYELSK